MCRKARRIRRINSIGGDDDHDGDGEQHWPADFNPDAHRTGYEARHCCCKEYPKTDGKAARDATCDALPASRKPGPNDRPALDLQSAATPLPHRGINRLGRGDLMALRPAADRNEPLQFTALDNRRYICPHPVEVAVLGAIFDQALPWPAGLGGRPKVAKSRLWHMRVADEIMRRSKQFLVA